MDNLDFIKELIEIENKNLPNNVYNNCHDKYTNGHCEDLVSFLYMANENKGKKIEVRGIFNDYEDDFDDDPYDAIVVHYIYQDENNLFYDINGEFENIEDLINSSFLMDSISNIKEIEIKSTYGMENNEMYLMKEVRK